MVIKKLNNSNSNSNSNSNNNIIIVIIIPNISNNKENRMEFDSISYLNQID